MRLSRRRWWVALLAEVALGAGVKGIHFATAAGGRACGRVRVRRRRAPAVRAVRVQLGSWIHSASVMEIGSWRQDSPWVVGNGAFVRAVFVLYLTVIVGGIAFF